MQNKIEVVIVVLNFSRYVYGFMAQFRFWPARGGLLRGKRHVYGRRYTFLIFCGYIGMPYHFRIVRLRRFQWYNWIWETFIFWSNPICKGVFFRLDVQKRLWRAIPKPSRHKISPPLWNWMHYSMESSKFPSHLTYWPYIVPKNWVFWPFWPFFWPFLAFFQAH